MEKSETLPVNLRFGKLGSFKTKHEYTWEQAEEIMEVVEAASKATIRAGRALVLNAIEEESN